MKFRVHNLESVSELVCVYFSEDKSLFEMKVFEAG